RYHFLTFQPTSHAPIQLPTVSPGYRYSTPQTSACAFLLSFPAQTCTLNLSFRARLQTTRTPGLFVPISGAYVMARSVDERTNTESSLPRWAVVWNFLAELCFCPLQLKWECNGMT
ncbi:unnamed protein product, partial [Ectocarpus fasciculatus]